jgi:hypothetical protein
MHASFILFSYIDPVSGVILLQLIIGGGIGCIAGFRRKIWRFGARLFAKRRIEEDLNDAAPRLLPLSSQLTGEIEPSADIESLGGPSAWKNSHERCEDRIAA